MKAVAYSFPTTIYDNDGGIAAGDTTVKIQHSEPPYAPALGAGEYTYAIISDDADFLDPNANYETVKVTDINTTTDIITMVRDQESTDGPKAWTDGTAIVFWLTAVGFNELQTIKEIDESKTYKYSLRQEDGHVWIDYTEVT